MLDLNSPLWEDLGGADVPDLLRALAECPDQQSWGEVYEALLDQGDVHTPAYAAVPHLREFALAQPVPSQVDFWDLIGFVASMGPNHRDLPESVRTDYLQALARVPGEILKAIGSRTVNESDTARLIQALAAAVGCYGPGRVLSDVLADCGHDAQCPHCNRMLHAEVHSDGVKIGTWDLLEGAVPKSSRVPISASAGSDALPTPDVLSPNTFLDWLPSLAAAGGHRSLADKLTTICREVPCPECGKSFSLMEEVCRRATFNLDGVTSEDLRLEGMTLPRKTPQSAADSFFRSQETLQTPDLVRVLLIAAEVEVYECALTADRLGAAEVAMAAAREWLRKPCEANADKARIAGSQALGLAAGAAATACGRLRQLAVKTCLDALSTLTSDIQSISFRRIRESLKLG